MDGQTFSVFVVVLTVYFICTYLSEFIEPLLQLLYIPTFGPFFSKFGNFYICNFVCFFFFNFFLNFFFFTYPGLCIGEDTQGCCVPSQLVKYFMPNVSRRLIRINVRQVHLDPSVGYDFVRMLSLLMI